MGDSSHHPSFKEHSMKKRKKVYVCLMIPAILFILVFIAVPLIHAVKISFFKWNGYSQSMKWVGAANFANALKDKLFWRSVGNTMIYGFGSTILQNVSGLLAALFLNRQFKGRNMVRLIIYMPIMISAFIMGQILYFFVQYEGGVFNELLALLGIAPVYFMKSGIRAAIMIMLVNSWQYMGLCMIIYLAGLQNIPVMYREAARIDGAGQIKEFFHITLPLLMPSVTTAVVTNLIGGFKLFDPIVAMSNGGPNKKSMSLSFYISTLYFNDEKAGYASAIGLLTVVLIMLIAVPVNAWLQKREVEY